MIPTPLTSGYTMRAATIACLLLGGCSGFDRPAGSGEAADVVLWEGSAYTVDETQPWAEAIAVKDGTIRFVGSSEGASAHIGEDTLVVDLDGRMVTPGFIDTHAHPTLAAGSSHALLLDRSATPEDWLEAVADHASDNPDRPYVLGFGFLAATFGPSGPTKEMLDAVVSDRPVVLIDEGGHSAWVNSKALEGAGIDAAFPDPIPGVHYFKRDADGNPTGWCLEAMTFNPLILELGLTSTETILDGADDVFWLLSSLGITTVFDAGMSVFEDIGFRALAELERQQRLPLRIVASHMIQSPHQVPGAVERLRSLRQTYGSDLVQPRVMKIHNDGTKEAFTAALFEPYVDQPDNAGAILLEGTTLRSFVSEIDRAGFDIHIHAIGDRAVDEGLDAFEAARVDNPTSTARYSMAHLEIVRDEDLPRFGPLDVVAQTTPIWFASELDYETKALGPQRARKLLRFAAIERAGARLSFGSDFPTGDLIGLSPLVNMEVGMTRRWPDHPDMATTPPVDAVLSLETMIKGYTINAAYQLNLERELGSLEVGKRADLVVLRENLFEIETQDIHDTRVALTMVNGDIVYERGVRTWVAEWMLGL